MEEKIAKLRDLLLSQSRAGRLRSLLDSIYGAAQTGAEAYGSASQPLNAQQAGMLGGMIADFTPVVGDVKSAYEGVQAAREGDYLGAGLGALGALPFVPSFGAGIKPTERLYHGSLGDLIGELRKGKGTLGEGFYLTNKPESATIYPKIHAIKQGIKKPEIKVTEMETSSKKWFDLDEHGGLPVSDIGKEFQDALKKAGYDGITIGNQVLIFDPATVRKK